MIQTRSIVLWRLVPVVQLGENENSVYKRLKRFMQYPLSQTMIARFVLSFLRQEQQVLLLLDRTNWKWGQQDINFLILSVSWRTFSFPLAWTLIPHRANSTSEQRIELLEAVMPLLAGKTVYLLADREFIGKKWFQALKRLHVLPCIRLKANSRVNGIPVWALLCKLEPGEMRYWYKSMCIYGVQLRQWFVQF
ncbi:transposase [Deinococcus fonticola]|uniref:transposase n=1 Tax=Deinococcus fonticola TaxID=2528713 RepID=UPI0010754735|nr:transposase [Deinococcus fonticola]